MILGQRIRLDPNNRQRTFFVRCAGAARFTWNWGLARWQELYESGQRPNWRGLNVELNGLKQTEARWLQDIPWAVTTYALRDLGAAFQAFFRRLKRGEKPGYPRFKSKKRSRLAFAIEGRALRFDGRRVRIPKLGWIRTRQQLRFPGRVVSARFSQSSAGHWYLSVQIEIDKSRWSYPHRCETQATVGIDLGLVDLVVLSTGEKFPAPRVLRRLERRLRKLNKELARRQKGGKNWQKTRRRLARLHERIANIRRDFAHKLTTSLVRRFRWIGLETLNVQGMLANRHLAKSVADAALAEIIRQLHYKADLAGCVIVQADRWFASSKTCNVCGHVLDDLALSTRTWTCPACQTIHDRDVNAARNLEKLAAAQAAAACRPDSSESVGQESGIRLLNTIRPV